MRKTVSSSEVLESFSSATMGDEIEMKLMFVNYDAPLADEVLKGVKISQPVSDVKKRIMTERWPEDHTPLDKVRHLSKLAASTDAHGDSIRTK